MQKLWKGRTDGTIDAATEAFNASIGVDSRMWREDIGGSIAHAAMLGAQGILTAAEAQTLTAGLAGILDDIERGALVVDPAAEDIHTFVEQELTARVGEVGKKLHTARSRNDQVALDLRLYLRKETDDITEKAKAFIVAVTDKAEAFFDTVMPGYTHLQRAQPITFGQHLMAYAMMLLRDVARLADCRKRLNLSPIGCCALAGTTYPTDRAAEAAALGFDGICQNSLDGVSDRDFALELMSALAILSMHLSRFAEEVILWCSWEFRFVELSDAFTTGSSIMPQKKNADMAELIRGKTGRVYGDLVALLTTMKGLPLAYNKDMQEDKERVFDACDTVRDCLLIFTGMVKTMRPLPENMKKAAGEGFINATDLADYLVGKGMPFRTAYGVAGETVAYCAAHGKVLETLSLDEYRALCPLIGEDVYAAVDLAACVARRTSAGGTAPQSVKAQIAYVRAALKNKE